LFFPMVRVAAIGLANTEKLNRLKMSVLIKKLLYSIFIFTIKK